MITKDSMKTHIHHVSSDEVYIETDEILQFQEQSWLKKNKQQKLEINTRTKEKKNQIKNLPLLLTQEGLGTSS